MTRSKPTVALLLLISISLDLFGQKTDSAMGAMKDFRNPPVPVEVMAGNTYLNFQMIIIKHFSPTSKFGFFNVTTFNADYNNDKFKNESLIQSFLTFDLFKGISLNAGALLNSRTGFRPNAGLQYTLANRKLLLVLFPHIDLTETYNFEIFSLLEFKPPIKGNWGLYTRLQTVYNYNSKLGFHERSFINLRLGLSYKTFAFGLGDNVDYYGPNHDNTNNFGVFIKADLFN